MKRTKAYITVFFMMIMLLAGCAVAAESGPDGYALTDEERDLLIKAFGNEENIRNGKLYGYQKDALEQLRAGMRYLESKYPGEPLTVTYFSNASKLTQQAFCNFEDRTGGVYDMTISCENGQYICRDTYYGELIRTDYDGELTGYLRDGGISAELYTSFSTPAGMDVNAGMTVRSINAIEPRIARCTHIFADESLKGTDSGAEIRSILEKNRAYGSYILYFVPDCAGKSTGDLEMIRTQFESVCFNIF